MIAIRFTAWSRLAIEEIFVWLGVTQAAAIVYEIARRWKSSGKRAKLAFFGSGS
jgi:hypothetical protein